MSVWKSRLQPSGLGFMQSIVDQVPEANGAREAFEMLLNKLAESVSDEQQHDLDLLDALHNEGVDNWDGYEAAVASLEDSDEDSDG